MTWVLPVPAPATTSSGPSPWVTARSWSGLRPPSSASSPVDRRSGRSAGSMTGTSSRQAGIWSSGTARGGRGSGSGHGRWRSAVGSGCRWGPCREHRRPPCHLGCQAVAWPMRRGLLVRQPGVGAAGRDRLGVDARPGAGVQARQDPAVAVRVEQGQGEALVAAGLLERVVADEPDALERLPLGGLEDGRPGDDLVELAGDRVDLVEVGVEDGLEARALGAAGQAGQPGVEPAVRRARTTTATSRISTTTTQADDEWRPRYGCDERVEVDPRVLRWGQPSLAARPCRGRTPAAAGGRAGAECYPLPSAARPPSAPSRRCRPIHRRRPFARPWPSAPAAARTRPGQRAPLQRTHGPTRRPSRPRRRPSVDGPGRPPR